MDYCLPQGYQARLEPDYFSDESSEGAWHPDVYPEAAALAKRLGARRIIDVGCRTAEKLTSLHSDLEIVGIDYRSNIETCRQRYESGTWLVVDLDRDDSLGISDFSDSVLVCADVIEHMTHPENLLRHLSNALDLGAGAIVLTTPDRELNYGPGHLGPPPNPAHVREWTSSELEQFMAACGLLGHFGRTRSGDLIPALRTILAVVPGRSAEQREVVGDWCEERARWQRLVEEQDRTIVQQQAWTGELRTMRDWSAQQCEAWEATALEKEVQLRERDQRIVELEAALAEALGPGALERTLRRWALRLTRPLAQVARRGRSRRW